MIQFRIFNIYTTLEQYVDMIERVEKNTKSEIRAQKAKMKQKECYLGDQETMKEALLCKSLILTLTLPLSSPNIPFSPLNLGSNKKDSELTADQKKIVKILRKNYKLSLRKSSQNEDIPQKGNP